MIYQNHETHNALVTAERTSAIVGAIAQAVPAAAASTLLDYGCGTGRAGLALADRFGRVVLADNDDAAVAAARVAAVGRTNVSVRRLDLTRELPDDVRADVVASALSWHHVHDLDALLDAITLVAPGGRLLVADMDEDGGAYHADEPGFDGVDGFDRTELAALVERHGYADVSVADLWQGTKWRSGTPVPMSLFFLSAVIPTS